MIQRIQSVFLILASLFFAGQFVFPMANSTNLKTGIFADSVYNVYDHTALLGITIGGAILALLGIFLFRNRKLQRSIAWIVALASIALAIMGFFVLNQSSLDLSKLSVHAGAFLPFGSLICAILAGRYISKDDNLVRSMDRLR